MNGNFIHLIHRNQSGIVYPNVKMRASNVICCIDLCTISTEKELFNFQEKALDIVAEWNTTMIYDQWKCKDIKKERKGNCQQFVFHLLEHLNLIDNLKRLPQTIRKDFSNFNSR